MNVIIAGGAIALSLVVAACGGSETAVNENRQSAEAPEMSGKAAQIHSGTGTVTAVDGNQVTIAHGAIESVGWAAMTMGFNSPARVLLGVRAGTQVNFSIRQDDGAYVLTSLQPR